MKQKVRRVSKSTLSIVLTLCMLFSCFTAAFVATDAATIDSAKVGASAPGTFFFDNTLTQWENVYCYIGKGDWTSCYKMSSTGTDNIFYRTIDSGWTDRTNIFFANARAQYNNEDIGEGGKGVAISNVSGLSNKTDLYGDGTMDKRIFAPSTSSGGAVNKFNAFVVVGNTSTIGANWTIGSTSDSQLMNYDGTGNRVYRTYTSVPAGNYTFCVAQYNNWGNSQRWEKKGTLTDNGIASWADAGDSDHNIKLSTTAVSNITIEFTGSDKVNVTVEPVEDTQTVYGVASPSAGGTVTPASASAGESQVKASFTAAAASGYTFTGWTLGSNLDYADSTTSSSTTVKLNVKDDTVSTQADNTATANFTHQAVEMHLGTTENAWSPTDVGDFTQVSTNLFEFDTANGSAHTTLTAGTTYYLCVSTQGASQSSGIYYKNNTSGHATLTTLGPVSVTAYTASGSASYGGLHGTIKFTPSETGEYTFTFDPVNGTISVRSSVDPTQPMYSLTGNVTDKYIVGSTIVKPGGVTDSVWWSTYHNEMAIDTPVDTQKYSITFTTTDYESGADINFASKNNKEYSFMLNGTAYNTYGHDLEVTRNYTTSDNLYVYNCSGGGSLHLQPNTTYTITVDQTKHYNNDASNPYGQITIDCTTVYANAVSMYRTFNPSTRRLNDAQEGTDGGTATASPASGNKNELDPTFTAGSPASGYTFTGWYTDSDLKTLKTTDTSFSEENIPVTHTYYALYSQNAPSTTYGINLDVNNSSWGSVIPASGVGPSVNSPGYTYEAYDGATVVINAIPADATSTAEYLLGSATDENNNCTVTCDTTNNTVTLTNITGDVDLTVNFVEKTTYTVTLVGTNGKVSAISYQSDGTTQYQSVSATKSGSIQVPIGGYLKLTAGDPDNGKEFSYFNLPAGKYKRQSSQNLGVSPCTIRPLADMTAEAVFDTGGSSTGAWSVDFNNTTNDASLKKYTGLIVTDFNDSDSTDVYYTSFTIPSGSNYFHVWDGTYDYKFENNAQNISLNSTSYPKSNWGTTLQDGKITVANDTTVYIYAKYNKVNVDSQTGKNEVKLLFSTTKLHGASADVDTTGYQRIFAMDGVVGSTAGFGDTVILKTGAVGLLESDIEDAQGNSDLYVKTHTDYNEYFFDPNKDITFRVQTTIASGHQALGVRGFVYNGKSVKAIDAGDGTYYADITVPAHSVVDVNGGTTNDPILEVIPVYYNTKIPESDYIKFYVDANTIGNEWGYNMGYSTWYQNTSLHGVEGSYPGQPLMKEGTKYVGYIPKYYLSTNASTGDTSGSPFSGVLMDNLAEHSDVHKAVLSSWGCDTTNYQTFDYEDPKKIMDLSTQQNPIDTIEFVAKFEETADNHLTGTHWYTDYNKPTLYNNGSFSSVALPSSIEVPTAANKLNGFELLRNFDNKPVDVYGNEITENFSNSVFVISVGNQTVGSNVWDTIWMIYDGGTGTHTFVKGGNPASFIGVDAANQDSGLKNKTVYISYEKFLDGHEKDGTNSGDRIDGRWLYSTSTDDTVAHIRVATLAKNGDTLNFMTYANGASGARIAYKDNSMDGFTQDPQRTSHTTYEPPEHTTQEDAYGRITEFDNRTTDAKAVLNEPNGYKIVGFYMQKMGVVSTATGLNGFSNTISDYDVMESDGTIAEYTNVRDTWIVAIVEEIPASDIHISHESYGGPDAHGGAGAYYIKAEVIHNNQVIYSTASLPGSVNGFVNGKTGADLEYINSVLKNDPSYTLRITLRTDMAGTNTFYNWYSKDFTTGDYHDEGHTNSSSQEARGQNSPQEKVIEYTAAQLYGNKLDGTFQYTNLNFYSDIDLEGTVYVSHQKLSTSTGNGKFYTKVEVLDSNDQVIKTFDYQQGTVTVPTTYTRKDSGNKLKFYLKSVPNAGCTYVNTYSDSTGTTAVTPASTISTGEITLAPIAVSSLYVNIGTTEDPAWEFDTTKSTYEYYSQLNQLSSEIKIHKNVDVNKAPTPETFIVQIQKWIPDQNDPTQGQYENYTGNYTIDGETGSPTHTIAAADNGIVSISGNETITLTDVPAGFKYKITELKLTNSDYVSDSTTPVSIGVVASGDTAGYEDTNTLSSDANIEAGMEFTLKTTGTTKVTFKNDIKRTQVTVKKEVIDGTSGNTEFPITVSYTLPSGVVGTYSGLLQHDGTFVVLDADSLNLPVGTTFTVSEASAVQGTSFPAGYVPVDVTGDSNITQDASTGVFTVGTSNALVTVRNRKLHNVTVTKSTGSYSDASSIFKFKILTSTDGANYTDLNAGTLNGTSGQTAVTSTPNQVGNAYEYPIKSGYSLVLPNLPKGTHVKIIETDPTDNYTHTNTTVTGAKSGTDSEITEGTKKGISFEIDETDAVVTINNAVITQTVTVYKKTWIRNGSQGNYTYEDFDYEDGSTFPVNVVWNELGSATSTYVPMTTGSMKVLSSSEPSTPNPSDGTYNIKRNGSITFKNVPKGSFIVVNENDNNIGVSNVTHEQRFVLDNISSSGAAQTGTNQTGQYHKVGDSAVNINVNNIIKKNTVTINKSTDVTDTASAHTIQVEIYKNGWGSQTASDKFGTITCTSSVSGNDQSVSDGQTLTIHGGETLTFTYPVGSLFKVSETAPHSNFVFSDISVSNDASDGTNYGITAPTKVNGVLTFQTADRNAAVTIQNNLKRFNLNITKETNVDDVSANPVQFKVKLYTSQTNNGSDWAAYTGTLTSSGRGTVTSRTADANGEYIITKGETLTVPNIPINTYVKIEEVNRQGYTLTGMSNTTFDSSTNSGVVQMTSAQSVTITNTMYHDVTITKSLNNSSDNSYNFPISVTLKPDGASGSSATTWSCTKNNTTSDTNLTTGITLKNGESIVLEDVPVNAQVTVTEGSLASTDFSFVSIGAKHGSTDYTDSDLTDQSITFTMADEASTVSIVNAIKTKTFNVKKVTDSGDGSGFQVIVQYKYSSDSASDAWRSYVTTPFNEASYVELNHNGTASVTLPLDASVKVGELDIPTPYKLVNISDGTNTYNENGHVFAGNAINNGDTITVKNRKTRALTIQKTTDVTTSETFDFYVYKWDDSLSTPAYVLIETDPGFTYSGSGSFNDTTHKLTLAKDATASMTVYTGEKYKVVEVPKIGTTFNYNASGSSVSPASGSSAVTNGFEDITIGADTTAVTINNVEKTKTLKVKKVVDFAYNDEPTFPITVYYKDSNNSWQTVTTDTINKDGSWKTITLRGAAAIATNLKVEEGTNTDTHYDLTLTTNSVANGTKDTSNSTATTIVFSSTESQSPEVTFNNFAKKANVYVKKNLTNYQTGDTTTFPITATYTTPGNSAVTDGPHNLAHDTQFRVGNNIALPVGTTITVTEGTMPTGYTAGTISGDGNITDNGNGSFTVLANANATITVNNSRDTAGFVIDKLTNINNTEDTFKIKIWTGNSASGPWTPYTSTIGSFTPNTEGTESTNTHYGEYTIHKGSQLSVEGLSANTYIKVEETDGMISKYTSSIAAKTNTTLESTSTNTVAIAKINSGTGQGIDITNTVRTQNVQIKKNVSGENDSTVTFPVKVTIVDEDTTAAAQYTITGSAEKITDGTAKTFSLHHNDTVTIESVPIGTQITVDETGTIDSRFSFTSIDYEHATEVTAATTATKTGIFKTSDKDNVAVFTVNNTRNTHDVKVLKNLTNSSSNQDFSVDVSIKKNAGDSSAVTTWTYADDNGTTHANASLSDIEIGNNEYFTLKDVPEGAVVTVSEDSVTGFTCTSIVPTRDDSSAVISSTSTATNDCTFSVPDDDVTVTINNKINDKTVKVKKVTDSEDGQNFNIKIQYKHSNDTAQAAWRTYSSENNTPFNADGVATLNHNGEASVSIPSDATIKVTELSGSPYPMPTGYQFVNITAGGSTYSNGDTISMSDLNANDIITVNNRKQRTLTITKTTDVATTESFDFEVYKYDTANSEYVKITSDPGFTFSGTGNTGTTASFSNGTLTLSSGKTASMTVYTDEIYKVVEVPKTGTTFNYNASGSSVTDGTSAITGANAPTAIENGFEGITIENDTTAVTMYNSQKTEDLEINKVVDFTHPTENTFTFKVEYKSGNDWIAYDGTYFSDSIQSGTLSSGQGTIRPDETATVRLAGIAVISEIRVSEVLPNNTHYQTPVLTLQEGRGTKVDADSTDGNIAFNLIDGYTPVVTITNSIKTQQVKIKKVVTEGTPAESQTFTIRAQYKTISDGTVVDHDDTNTTYTNNQERSFTVPVGSTITVSETAPEGYSLVGITGTNINGTSGEFTVEESSTTPVITVTNKKLHRIKIKKNLTSSITNDPQTFTVDYSYTLNETTVTGTTTALGHNGEYTIPAWLPKNTEITVTENQVSGYTLINYTGTDISLKQNETNIFVVGETDGVINVNNRLDEAALTITKAVDYSYSGETSFPITVEYYNSGTWTAVPNAPTAVPANGTPVTVPLTGSLTAVGVQFRVTETENSNTHYDISQTTMSAANASNSSYNRTDHCITFETSSTSAYPSVTINNYAKKADVVITKDVDNIVTSATFPVDVKLVAPDKTSGTNEYSYTGGGTIVSDAQSATTVNVTETSSVTISNVPVGTQFEVEEQSLTGTRFSFKSIDATGGVEGTPTVSNQKVTFTTTGDAQANVPIVNEVNTHNVTITKALENSNNSTQKFKISATIRPDGASDSAHETSTWSRTIDTAAQATDSLTDMEITNGQDIVIYGVPDGAQVTVTEADLASTDFEFVSIVKTTNPTVSNANGSKSCTFTTNNGEGTSVTVTNKITDKTVTIKKTVDQGSGNFRIKVEVKNSNASVFSNYDGDGFSGGKKAITAGGDGVAVTVPMDAEVKVSELFVDILTGYEFEKFSEKIGNGEDTDITNPDDVTDGNTPPETIGKSYTYSGTSDATITVHNKKIQNGLTVTKVCDNGDPGDSTFTIRVTYRRPTDDSDQTHDFVLQNNHSETLPLPYGTRIISVEETSLVAGFRMASVKVGTGQNPNDFAAFDLISPETITVHNELTTHTVTIVKKVVDESGDEISSDTQTFGVSVQKDSGTATSYNFSQSNSVTLTDVPYGTVVTVTESTPLPRGYELVSYSSNNGQAITENTTITVTNKKLNTHEVKVKKVVDKDSGNTEFGMKISTTAIPYSYLKYNSSNVAQGTAVDMSSGGEATFNLKKDEYVIVSGLYKDEVLTVQETYNGSEYAFEKFVVNSADYTGTVTNQAMSYTVLSSPAVQTIDVSNVNAITTKYNITYNFTSYRSLYGDMSYSTGAQDFTATELTSLTSGTVKNVSGGDVTALKFNTVTAMKSFIDNHAPYEDGFRESVTWISGKVDNTDTNISTKFVTAPTYSDLAENGVKLSYNEAGNLLTIIVNAEQADVGPVTAQFVLPYKTTQNNDSLVPDGEIPERIDPLARDEITTSQQGLIIIDGNLYQAPEKLNDGKYFSYWKMYTPVQDIFNSSDTNKPYSKCYSRSFNFVLYQNSIIEAVYDNSEPVSPHDEAVKDGNDQKATITFMENSRTQWNGYPDDNETKYAKDDNWKLGDRVYTDFLLSFEYNDLQLNTDNSGTYEYGIVIETLDDVTTMANWDPVKGATEYTQSDYSAKFGSTHNENDVKTFIQSGSAGNHTFSKSQKSVKGLDNKNRVDFYHAMALITQKYGDGNWGKANNKEDYVYRAYSYLYNAETGTVLLVSDPLYFTVYDIANINYQASATP